MPSITNTSGNKHLAQTLNASLEQNYSGEVLQLDGVCGGAGGKGGKGDNLIKIRWGCALAFQNPHPI